MKSYTTYFYTTNESGEKVLSFIRELKSNWIPRGRWYMEIDSKGAPTINIPMIRKVVQDFDTNTVEIYY
jgi:hypothetical protein